MRLYDASLYWAHCLRDVDTAVSNVQIRLINVSFASFCVNCNAKLKVIKAK